MRCRAAGADPMVRDALWDAAARAAVNGDDLAARIVGHYERHARAWDADRRGNAWSDRPWLERFVAKLPSRATVLDLGCGGGDPVAMFLAASGMRVTGVDTSPTLIALARDRLPEHEWIVADMRTLALGRRFDGILAWDGFFHLTHDDQRGMFGVFADHARRESTLMFNAGPSHGVAIGSYRGDPLFHASLASDEYETLLRRFGFEIVAHVAEDADTGGRTAWIARSS